MHQIIIGKQGRRFRTYSNGEAVNFFVQNWNSLPYWQLRIHRVSKRKTRITFRKRNSAPVSAVIQNTHPIISKIQARINVNRQTDLLKQGLSGPNDKALNLVKKVSIQDYRIKFKEKTLLIDSKNGRNYTVSRRVTDCGTMRNPCVAMSWKNNDLPPADRILAKSLVLAHRPDLIWTIPSKR